MLTRSFLSAVEPCFESGAQVTFLYRHPLTAQSERVNAFLMTRHFGLARPPSSNTSGQDWVEVSSQFM